MEHEFYVIMWNSSYSRAQGNWTRSFYELGATSKFQTIDAAYAAIVARYENWPRTVAQVAIVGCDGFFGRRLSVNVADIRRHFNEPDLPLGGNRG